jgi:hypothetical protein
MLITPCLDEGSQAESTNIQRNCSRSLAALGRGALFASFDPLRGSLLVVCALWHLCLGEARRRGQSCVCPMCVCVWGGVCVCVCVCVVLLLLCRGQRMGVRGGREAWATPSFNVAAFSNTSSVVLDCRFLVTVRGTQATSETIVIGWGWE